MPTLQRKRIRLAALADKYDSMKDVLTTSTPEMWRGNDCQFELGVLFANVILQDVSNFDSITLVARATPTSEAVLMIKSVAAADINQALTDEAWEDQSAQHAVIAFTAAETNLDLDPDAEQTIHLAIEAITTDTPARHITLGVTRLKVREDGIGTAGDPPTNDPLYLPEVQSDARYARLTPADGSYRVRTDGNGTFFQLWNPEQAKFHTVWVIGAAGEERLFVGPGEV